MKLNNKGFSLVEVLLAVVISTIVFGAITALIVFSSKSSKETNERIALQNEVKDAMNHIESYCMEAENASWQEETIGGQNIKILVLYQKRKDSAPIISGGAVQVSEVEKITSNAYAYWFMNNGIYFGKCSQGGNVKLDSVTADNIYLLADNITDFDCAVEKNETSGKYTIDLNVDAKVSNASYSANKTVYIRNQ